MGSLVQRMQAMEAIEKDLANQSLDQAPISSNPSLPQGPSTIEEPDPNLSNLSDQDIQDIQDIQLSTIEQTIIELHLEGLSNIAISKALKCTPANVSYYLRKDNVKAFLVSVNEDSELRLKNLKNKFVDVIAKGLKSDVGINTQLKAARLFKDATKDIEDNKTAEDVVSKLLNLQVNVQVNQTNQIESNGDK